MADSVPRSTSYISARLAKSLAIDDGGSRIKVLTLQDCSRSLPQDSEPTIEKAASFLSNSEPGFCGQVLNARQISQVIDIDSDVTYLISIGQSNSLSHLSISHDLLTALIHHCRLSLKLYDFVAFFGPRHGETSLSPPMTYTHLDVVDEQIVQQVYIYVLRFPESHGRAETHPFSIRQSLICHQHSTATSASFLLTTGTASAVDNYLTDEFETPNSIRPPPWRMHFDLLNVAISAWRPYISYLSEQIDAQSDLAITADLDEDGLDHATLETRQFLKQLEDMLAEVTLNLNHTMKTTKALQRQRDLMHRYQKQKDSYSSTRYPTCEDCAMICTNLQDTLNHYLEQSEALKSKVNSTANLVSNILELNNSNTLKLLAIKAADEGVVMQELTKKATQDAAAVKVLTVLTLIYLPSTVVMNFFSTSFVNMTTEASGSSILTIASNWWISIAATVPLTFITLYIWWFYVQKELSGEWPLTWRKCTQTARNLQLCHKRFRHRDQNVSSQHPWDVPGSGLHSRQNVMQMP